MAKYRDLPQKVKKGFRKLKYELNLTRETLSILYSYYLGQFKQIIKDYRESEPKWLSQELKEKTRDLSPKREKFVFKLDLDESSPGVVPETIICFTLVIMILIGVRLSFQGFGFSKSFFSSLNHSDLGQIHAGIGAVIFALIIFIAESLRDDEGKDKAKVLLRDSLILPITVFEILTFFLMIFDQYVPTSIQASLVLIVGIMLLWSLGTLVYILLNESVYESRRLKMFSERLSLTVDISIKERIANNILNKKLEGLVSWYPAWNDKKTFTNFYLSKYGVVKDIKLDAPQKIVNVIEKKLNMVGKSLYKDKEKLEKTYKSNLLPSITKGKYDYTEGRIFWSVLYNSEIKPEENIVLQVSAELIDSDESLINEITSILKNSIFVNKGKNSIGVIYDEFQTLRHSILNSIKNINTVDLRRHLKTYLLLVDSFLKALTKYIKFNSEQAKEENKNINSLQPLSVLEEDLSDYIDEAYKSADQDILEHITYLPFALVKKSLDYEDHLTFQRYSGYIIRCFWISYEIKDEKVSKKQREEICGHLSSLVQYYIEPAIKENLEKEDMVDFALNILITLQNLLKQTVDKNDITSFIKLQKITFEFLDRKYDRHDTETEAIKKFEGYRNTFIFAFNAWLYKRIKREKDLNSPFFDSLKSELPKTLQELFNVYILVNDRKIESFFGWSWWDIPRDGEVHTMHSGRDTEDLFIYLLFKILDADPEINVADLNLPPVRDISNYSKNEQINPLSRYTSIPFNLTTVNSFEVLRDRIMSIFSRVNQLQEEIDNVRLVTATVSEQRKKEFYEDIVKNYEQYTTLRNILKRHNKIKKRVEKNYKNSFGYNQIYPKEYFVEGWHIGYVGLGDIGENFARSEDNIFLESLTNQINEKSKIKKEDLLTEIKKTVSTSKYSNHYLILWLDKYLNFEDLFKSELFTPTWKLKNTENYIEGIPYFQGCLTIDGKSIPVMTIYSIKDTGHINQAFLFSPTVIQIKEYPFIKNDLSEIVRTDSNGFYFNLPDLNLDDKRRINLLERNPDWLKKEASPEEYLRRKVIFYMFRNDELVLKERTGIVCFLII